jgi:hypothetical protein
MTLIFINRCGWPGEPATAKPAGSNPPLQAGARFSTLPPLKGCNKIILADTTYDLGRERGEQRFLFALSAWQNFFTASYIESRWPLSGSNSVT